MPQPSLLHAGERQKGSFWSCHRIARQGPAHGGIIMGPQWTVSILEGRGCTPWGQVKLPLQTAPGFKGGPPLLSVRLLSAAGTIKSSNSWKSKWSRQVGRGPRAGPGVGDDLAQLPAATGRPPLIRGALGAQGDMLFSLLLSMDSFLRRT